MASGHRWNSVGDMFVQHLTAQYGQDGPVHWPTVIAAAGALCGEAALTARESRLPEFGVVESRKVSDFIHGEASSTRTIWGYATTIAQEAYGVDVGTLPSYKQVVETLGVQLLPGSFPALAVPAHLMPRETPLNAGPQHRKTIYGFATEAGLTTEDCAFALATAAMKMIGTVQPLGVRDLTALALQAVVAGSRFAPFYQTMDNPAFAPVPKPEPVADEDTVNGVSMPAAEAVAAALSTSRREVGGFGKRR